VLKFDDAHRCFLVVLLLEGTLMARVMTTGRPITAELYQLRQQLQTTTNGRALA